MIYDDGKFARIWNSSQEIEDVMTATNLNYSQVTVKAYNLRKKGIYIKKMYKPKGDQKWKEIGRLGGKKKVPKGFALMEKNRLKQVAKIGGKNSKPTKKVL